MGAQLTAGKAQVNAILGRMENLPAGSPLLPILAGTLATTLNELTDANGKKLNLGDKLYDESGEVTPETVAATRIAVNSYFADMQRQIGSASAQYENGKRELEESRKAAGYLQERVGKCRGSIGQRRKRSLPTPV